MLITDYQYFGSICFIELIYKQDQVYFDKYAPFTKLSFKNRMVILSAQGPLTLTIPIEGGRDQKTAMKDIRIAYDAPWQAQNFKAIQTCYKRSPFFEYYEAALKKIYTTEKEYLVDFLDSCNEFVKTSLKGKWLLIENNLQEQNTASKTILPWRPNNFAQFSIKNKYQQVFASPEGFISNLSILDNLFCVGGKEISKQLSAHLNLQ